MLELSPDRYRLWPLLYLVGCKIGTLDPNTKARRRRKLKASDFTVRNYVMFCFVLFHFFFFFPFLVISLNYVRNVLILQLEICRKHS